MTTPDDGNYDPSTHLSVDDIALDHPCRPTHIRVTIKQSKTDPFRKGVNLFVGRTDGDLCPVGALLNYLACRSTRPGPLFILSDGHPLTQKKFVIKEIIAATVSESARLQPQPLGV